MTCYSEYSLPRLKNMQRDIKLVTERVICKMSNDSLPKTKLLVCIIIIIIIFVFQISGCQTAP